MSRSFNQRPRRCSSQCMVVHIKKFDGPIEKQYYPIIVALLRSSWQRPFILELTMITKNHLSSILVALVFGVNAGGAIAQSYPTKPIRFIVPFPAGGSTDVGARVIAQYLSRSLCQQVYVENK